MSSALDLVSNLDHECFSCMFTLKRGDIAVAGCCGVYLCSPCSVQLALDRQRCKCGQPYRASFAPPNPQMVEILLKKEISCEDCKALIKVGHIDRHSKEECPEATIKCKSKLSFDQFTWSCKTAYKRRDGHSCTIGRIRKTVDCHELIRHLFLSITLKGWDLTSKYAIRAQGSGSGISTGIDETTVERFESQVKGKYQEPPDDAVICVNLNSKPDDIQFMVVKPRDPLTNEIDHIRLTDIIAFKCIQSGFDYQYVKESLKPMLERCDIEGWEDLLKESPLGTLEAYLDRNNLYSPITAVPIPSKLELDAGSSQPENVDPDVSIRLRMKRAREDDCNHPNSSQHRLSARKRKPVAMN